MRHAVLAVLAALAGCGDFGNVNQGQVIHYDRDGGTISLISDSNYRDPAHPRFDVLPAVTIRRPADPGEMGPEPEAGRLLQLDSASGIAVVYDAEARALRNVRYRALSEQTGVLPGDPRARRPGLPVIDPAARTVTTYVARERKLVELAVLDDTAEMTQEAWRFGDEIRYYYKDPGQALRLMNVTKTDVGKAGR